MHIEIVGKICNVEVIAVGGRIRDIMRIQKRYGPGRWRKLKGEGTIRMPNGSLRRAELHWYEAHGIGRKNMKIKRLIR
ncbi:MAG TPA: hypothetical protein PKE26_00590 [Kiritimatiellia bacterium]|nr:hypothetical protein [Kiritimatiellia bacterium]HMO97590.1 hypothetical protein [Kiritimatiellia bacterium]HMP96787.1 hypothetical protein [Kiritimatiellia bacterium]